MDRVTEHARETVERQNTSGLLHIQSCERHLRDLERQNTEGFPYIWMPEKAEAVINFANALTLAEGEKPRPLTLLGHQEYDIGSIYGWVRVSNLKRRFRRSYLSMARQQGKTITNGIHGTNISYFGGYNLGKMFTVATKKRQAKLAWEEIAKFISADPDLYELFEIKDYKSLITCIDTGCTIEALSKEAGLDDGFRSIFSSLDEIHQMRDGSIYNAIYNGTGELEETLISMITTRGKSTNSFCYEMDTYCQNILLGVAVAEDFFVDIYCLDKNDDYFDENVWIKAKPYSMTTAKGRESMRQAAQTAKDMGGSAMSDFLTKHLNLWSTELDNAYLDPDAWQVCATDDTLEDMQGRSCYVGLDLSSGGDLTSFSLVFPLERDEAFVHSQSFMPRGRFEEHIQTDLAPYDTWARDGLIVITGDSSDYINDYLFIIAELDRLREEYGLTYLAIGYDPHNAAALISDLQEFGCPLISVTQTARNLNDATEAFRLAVKSKKVRWNRNNGLLNWSMMNAKLTANSMGEVKIMKPANERNKRIDPADAVIDAWHAQLTTAPPVDINAAILSAEWSL